MRGQKQHGGHVESITDEEHNRFFYGVTNAEYLLFSLKKSDLVIVQYYSESRKHMTGLKTNSN